MNDPIMVVCPVCNGDGISPYGHGTANPTCKVCKGAGELTERDMGALRRISAKFAATIREMELGKEGK